MYARKEGRKGILVGDSEITQEQRQSDRRVCSFCGPLVSRPLRWLARSVSSSLRMIFVRELSMMRRRRLFFRRGKIKSWSMYWAVSMSYA